MVTSSLPGFPKIENLHAIECWSERSLNKRERERRAGALGYLNPSTHQLTQAPSVYSRVEVAVRLLEIVGTSDSSDLVVLCGSVFLYEVFLHVTRDLIYVGTRCYLDCGYPPPWNRCEKPLRVGPLRWRATNNGYMHA